VAGMDEHWLAGARRVASSTGELVPVHGEQWPSRAWASRGHHGVQWGVAAVTSRHGSRHSRWRTSRLRRSRWRIKCYQNFDKTIFRIIFRIEKYFQFFQKYIQNLKVSLYSEFLKQVHSCNYKVGV
jgi:hypothetical protein